MFEYPPASWCVCKFVCMPGQTGQLGIYPTIVDFGWKEPLLSFVYNNKELSTIQTSSVLKYH